ncbi:hypothetical protein B0J14DRAFT_167394 [Halenospora varia]|nr:hypothetical protein B0J14DRAFT_167394 [Halenospora varia]
MLHRKVNTMPKNEIIDDYAFVLASNAEEASDISMPHMVKMIHILGEIRYTFGISYPDEQITVGDEKLRLYSKAMEVKLREVTMYLPALSINSSELTALCHMVKILTLGAGIHMTSTNAELSITRVTILFDCLDSCQAYLGVIRNLSVEEMRPWTFLNWRLLNHALMTFSKLIIAIEPSASTPESVSRIKVLDEYLQWAVIRLRDAYSISIARDCEHAALTHLLSLWEETQALLVQMLRYKNTEEQQPVSWNCDSGTDTHGNTYDMYQQPGTISQLGSIQSFQEINFSNLWTNDDFWV